MNKDNLLSICIPTYNRPHFIKEQLDKIIPIVEKYLVPIYISDNSDNTHTEEIVRQFNNPFIHYSRNEQNICDRNFLKVLQTSQSDFRWLLSDSNFFTLELLELVIEKCKEKKYDYLFVNTGRVKNIESKSYESGNVLLSELGWHLTQISANIYSQNVIQSASRIERYLDTNFIQHALTFELWAFNHYKAYWISQPSLNSLNINKTNTWTNLTFEVWLKRWTDYVFSLPGTYSIDSKLKCIRDHDKYTNLFGFKELFVKRALGILNFSDHIIYKKYCNIAISKNRHLLMILFSYIPKKIVYPNYWVLKKSYELIKSSRRSSDDRTDH